MTVKPPRFLLGLALALGERVEVLAQVLELRLRQANAVVELVAAQLKLLVLALEAGHLDAARLDLRLIAGDLRRQLVLLGGPLGPLRVHRLAGREQLEVAVRRDVQLDVRAAAVPADQDVGLDHDPRRRCALTGLAGDRSEPGGGEQDGAGGRPAACDRPATRTPTARRRRRGRTSPCRLSIAPAVLGAGQRCSGCARRNAATTLRGPQDRCSSRSATISFTTAAGVPCGRRRGARRRSTKPSIPAAWNRRNHL